MQVLGSSSKTNNDGNIFSTLSRTYDYYKTAKDFGNLFQSVTGALDKSDNNNYEKTGNEQYSNRPSLSQFFNAFSNSQTTTASPSTVNQENFNNPLGAIFNYFSSTNGGSSILSRKKKPMEMEDYINGLTAASSQISPTIAVKTPEQVQIAQPTPTACPSVEEYITPVYARNYQNVWKYVVQIPHEGYFTQTIQKTSCVYVFRSFKN